jgi:6-pyruvoyltetrahydropterin/6-carboxytetrahydropterin synthase
VFPRCDFIEKVTQVFELSVCVNFSSAHHLRGYEGDCARPHGHTWKVEFHASAEQLDSVGMALDFRVLKKAAREIVSAWDHRDLNELPDFKSVNPTAENIARLCFERLEAALKSSGASADKVTVWESEDAAATYRPRR